MAKSKSPTALPEALPYKRLQALLLLGLLAIGVFSFLSHAATVRRFAHLDFFDYFYAARAIRYGASPYDTVLADTWARADGMPFEPGSDYIYPSWFAAVLVPFTFLPPRAAAAAWYALSSIFFLSSLRWLLPSESRRWWIVFTLFPPTLFTLFIGQVNAVLLWLLAVAWSLRARDPARAGMALGLTIGIKLAPALLVGVALAAGHRRVAAWACTTVAALVVLGETVSTGSTLAYVQEVLPRITSLPTSQAHPINQSAAGFLMRCLSENPWTRPLWHAPHRVSLLAHSVRVTLVGLVAVQAIRLRRSGVAEHSAWAVAICGMVIAMPLAWEATYILLLLPIALAFEAHRLPPLALAALALITLQRALDPFANDPARFPWLVACPPLSSPALLGAVLLLAYFVKLPPEEAETSTR